MGNRTENDDAREAITNYAAAAFDELAENERAYVADVAGEDPRARLELIAKGKRRGFFRSRRADGGG